MKESSTFIYNALKVTYLYTFFKTEISFQSK